MKVKQHIGVCVDGRERLATQGLDGIWRADFIWPQEAGGDGEVLIQMKARSRKQIVQQLENVLATEWRMIANGVCDIGGYLAVSDAQSAGEERIIGFGDTPEEAYMDPASQDLPAMVKPCTRNLYKLVIHEGEAADFGELTNGICCTVEEEEKQD